MKLYNTLSRKIEDFRPLDGKKVSLFVCGPTVYDYSHIGHAKTYIQMDVLARVLKLFYDVTYIQNITDIDDKIIARAVEKNIAWSELSRQYEDEYHKDMQTLGNTSVNQYVRATDHIPEIISQVERLMGKGHAYVIEEDGIYFEITTFKDYGKLSGRQEVRENDAESRIDKSERKRGWNDFCVWKFSKPGEPVWEAPFGAGRPGWHIEDTAITEHYFGPQYDIHGGAVDLIFPHHEAELTQMEALSGKVPFVKYWVHSGFLNINDTKMSKSLGNFFTIREVLEKGYDPNAIRLFMLQTHYHSPINFSWGNLDAAANRLKNWQAVASLRWQAREEIEDDMGDYIATVDGDVKSPLQDDLNTPQALANIDQRFAQFANNLVSTKNVHHFTEYLRTVDEMLGTSLEYVSDITDRQKELINQREQAREQKDWAESDNFRGQLKEQGIGLRDAEYGAIWYRL